MFQGKGKGLRGLVILECMVGILYRRLLRCMCSQRVQGSVYPGTHKGGKAVSHSVRYSDNLNFFQSLIRGTFTSSNSQEVRA